MIRLLRNLLFHNASSDDLNRRGFADALDRDRSEHALLRLEPHSIAEPTTALRDGSRRRHPDIEIRRRNRLGSRTSGG